MSNTTAATPVASGQIFVARQPILDMRRRVFGYELLYRHTGESENAKDGGVSADHATAHLICDGLLAIGLDTLTDGRKAFINVSRRLLLDGIPAVLPPDRVVFELGTDVEADSEVIDACKALKAKGYTLAIDDFAMTEWLLDLGPLARYVQVDVSVQDSGERPRVTKADLPNGPSIVGKKIESSEQFDRAIADGYSYVQGFFFGRPVMQRGRAVPAQPLALMQLVRATDARNRATVGRNDPCPCGSGRKYKRCCLNK